MRVGWLADTPQYLGGAERTMAEFRAAAPDGVKVVECSPGRVVGGLDVYVLGNVTSYSADDLPNAPLVRYLHDVWPHGDPLLRERVLDRARLVFCSPLHKRRFPWDHVDAGAVIPPAIDLERFREAGRRSTARHGSVWLGSMFFHGSGVQQAAEWTDAGESLDFYGEGPYVPVETERIRVRGAVDYAEVPEVLARYERFVFLPTTTEPFGRAVVEAWAAGCELVLNRNVGARHFIEADPGALEAAADTFWAFVTS